MLLNWGDTPTRAGNTRVDPTLQHKNRVEILVDGPEIVVRAVRTQVT
jgi:hypothetical protein